MLDESSIGSRRWSRRGSLLLVALVSFLFQLVFFDRWFSAMDEGHMLQFADIVAKGGELYRDATLYPLPGAFYFLALIFKFFDPSILLSRWIVVVQFTLFVTLVFAYLRHLVTPLYAAIGVGLLLLYRIWAFPHWHFYSYSTTALLILFGSMMLMIRFFETGKRPMLGWSGLLVGLGVLCKQDYGAAALLAMSVTLAVYARSHLSRERQPLLALYVWLLLPAALVGAATGIYFWRQDLLSDLIQFTVLNHFVGMAAFEYSSFPSLLPLFVQDPLLRSEVGVLVYLPGIIFTVDLEAFRKLFVYTDTAVYDTVLKVFFYGPYLLLLCGAVHLWRGRSGLAEPQGRHRFLRELVLFSFAAALIVLVSLSKPQDYLHLAVLYWPLLCLGTVYAQTLLRGRRTLGWVLAAVLVLPAGVGIGYTSRLVWRLRTIHSEHLSDKRAGIYVTPSESRMLRGVVDYVRANSTPDETVAVMPYFPIVNFLSDRRGPHRSSYIVWPFPELPDRDRRISDAMEAKKTSIVIYNFTQFVSFPPFEEYAPELFSYLVEHFEIDRIYTYDAWGYKLASLRRTTGTPDGQPLLGTDASRGFLRLEEEGSPPRAVPPWERSQYLAPDRWPFRPVLALRPTVEKGRTVLSVPLEVVPGAHLRTAVAVNPRFWFEVPKSWVRFTLEVEADGDREVLFSRTLDPTVVFADRGWFQIDVPLDGYAGRSVLLEFSTACEGPVGERPLMAGWAVPRIVVPAMRRSEPGGPA